ncbi:MAG: hypothetical protein QM703_16675 [Gemmatales bacterium]
MTRIAGTIREAGLAAVHAGDLTKTRCALEVLLPMVSPTSGSSIWGEILQKQSDPDALSWDMRTYLLPKMARLRPLSVGQTPDADMARWLRIPADKLGSLLSMSSVAGVSDHHLSGDVGGWRGESADGSERISWQSADGNDGAAATAGHRPGQEHCS